MNPPSHLHSDVHVTPALQHLQFLLHAFVKPQSKRMAHALLASACVSKGCPKRQTYLTMVIPYQSQVHVVFFADGYLFSDKTGLQYRYLNVLEKCSLGCWDIL